MAAFGRATFERVVISYCLSMIPTWQPVLKAALDLLPPGGELHIADFGGQERLPRWFRAALRQWLKAFHVIPRDTLEAEVRTLAAARDMTLSFERPYFGYCYLVVVKRPSHRGTRAMCR
jgi:S-adenosylmethionine-diacylgycerolhomoserine-N-methlytransferase